MFESASRGSTVRQFAQVCRILERFDYDPAKMIPILQAVQEEYRYLPEEVMAFLATSLNVSPARVYSVATFYSHFALEPKGKYVVRLCDGTACHVKDSEPIYEALRAKLGLTGKRKTTPDHEFTVETVSCLGACGLAPVMVVNERVYGQVTPDNACAIIDGLRNGEVRA